MCPEALFPDICQCEVKCVCKIESVVFPSEHSYYRISCPPRYASPVVVLIIEPEVLVSVRIDSPRAQRARDNNLVGDTGPEREVALEVDAAE